MKIPYKLNPFGKADSSWKPYGPTNGLVFYAPLEENEKELTRGELSTSGSINFTTQNELKAFTCTSSQYGTLYTNVQGQINDANIFSISFWMNRAFSNYANSLFFEFGNTARSGKKAFYIKDYYGINPGIVDGGELSYATSSYIPYQKWFHCVMILDRINGRITLYVDGQYKNYWNRDIFKQFNFDFNGLAIGSNLIFTENWKNGYLCGFRLYNRELTQSEITELSQEYTPIYEITASDQTFRFTPVDDPNTKDIVYSSKGTVSSFEIISGELPNTITFNTSTGKFSGKALTDANHTYNLVVRMSGNNVVTKDINVTINTVSTTNLSITSPQTFNFITEKQESGKIVYNFEAYDYSSLEITQGSLPSGVTIYYGDGGGIDEPIGRRWYLSSSGNQTSSSSSSFQIAITTQFHPTPVYATINVNIALNQITVPDKSFKFYIDDGSVSRSVEYTTQNTITPVYSLSGNLPSGFTFDSSTGTFTYDGVYDTPTSGEVNVIVNSSTGCSTQGMGKYTFELKSGSVPLPSDYSFYAPLQDVNETQAETGQQILDKYNMSGLLTAETFKGVPCIHSSASSYVKRWWRYAQTGIASGSSHRSISVWVYFTNSANVIFAYGQTGSSPIVGGWIRLSKDMFDFAHYGYSFTNFTAQLNTWYHFVVNISTNSSGYPVIQLYINGELKETGTASRNNFNTQDGGLYVFGNNWLDGWFSGYISSLRIYNRVLSQAEITKLYQEFTPTA